MTRNVTSPDARPKAERSHSTITLSWYSVVALVLVPLVVAGALIGTTWHMTDRLGQVKAAIVNEDAGVTLNGQFVPLGRQLSGELITSSTTTTDGRTIAWQLTSASSASDGLKDGSYAAAITIPKSFSKDATSFSANDADTARQAVVSVATSVSSPVTDTTIATITAQAAQNSLNKTLNSQYLGNIYIGFNKLADSMVSVGKGAKQLDDGAQQLAGGVKEATGGTQQLAGGAAKLDAGGQTLSTAGGKLLVGVSQLSAGVGLLDANGAKLTSGGSQLAAGAATLDASSGKLTSGGSQLAAGAATLDATSSQLDAGGQKLAAGAATLDASSGRLTSGGSQLAAGAATLDANGAQLDAGGQKLASGAAQVSTGLNQMDSQLQNTSVSIPQVSQQQLDQLAQLRTGATQVADASAGIYSGMKKYQSAMADPSDAQVNQIVAQVCARSPQSCSTPEAKKELAAGVKAGMGAAAQSMGSADDSDSLIGRADTANQGIQSYATKISGGVEQLTGLFAKAPEIQKQLTALKDGVHQLATGAAQVSTGVSTYTSGVSKYTAGVHTLSSGVSTYTSGVSKYTAGVHTLSSGVSTYTSGVSKYTAGVHTLAEQMPQMTSGAQQYVAGVDQFAGGVHQLSTGAEKLYAGQVKLSQGAAKYAKGASTFATQVAKGATQVPTFSTSDREKLADVVSAPVSASSTPMGTSAWVVGLVLILGLWIGALAIWLVARTIPSRVLTSSRSTLSLLWSSLSTGTGVILVSSAGLAVLATVTTGISALRGLGLFGMLLLVGAMFLVVNHALAAWLHAVGRFISAVFVAAAAAVGVVSAVPAPVRWIHDISPLKPAMDTVTAILAGNSPGFGPLLTIILWLAIGGLASLLAVNRARHTSVAKVLAEVS